MAAQVEVESSCGAQLLELPLAEAMFEAIWCQNLMSTLKTKSRYALITISLPFTETSDRDVANIGRNESNNPTLTDIPRKLM